MHDGAIICFPLSDLHAAVSRRAVPLLHCSHCECHVKGWLFQEVRRDSFLSLRRQSLGTVKPGTGQFTLADYFEVSQEASFNLSFKRFSRSSVMANVLNLQGTMHEGRRWCLHAKVRLTLVL